jgi:Pectate lyase superfamily protein
MTRPPSNLSIKHRLSPASLFFLPIAILAWIAVAPVTLAQSPSSHSAAAVDLRPQIPSQTRHLPTQSASATPALPRSCEIQRACTINPIFAIGMKCDGATDDSAALQSALTSASDPGLGNTKVVLPPGTCIIDPAAAITINSGLWLQGAGRYGTTLKRKNSSAGGALLTFNADGITLSDFAIDGNKGGSGITAAADSILVNAPSSGVTITRMHFLNASGSDISSLKSGVGIFISDWLIVNNDFDNGGTPACAVALLCSNILLRQPHGVTILGNRSDSSQHFVLLSSIPSGGGVNIGQNILTNLNGFGVALGGGPVGAADAYIHDNFITSLQSDAFNLIDVSLWTDFNVNHNTIYHNGVVPTSSGSATSCIADFPPAYRGTIDANICYLLSTTSIDAYGIMMGGDDISITDNFIQGASAAGISYNVSAARSIRGVRIIGNTTKNSSQRAPGMHAGIEIQLGAGGLNLARLADVIISGNHSYDDQTQKTQGYGIGIALAGSPTNIFNVSIQGNDVAGNIAAGVLNSAQSLSGLVIRNNFGYNPVGVLSPPPFPSPGSGPVVNTTGIDSTIYITSGTAPVTVAINGTLVKALTVPGGGVVGTPIRLPANQNITVSYGGSGKLSPTWQWVGD